MIDPRDSNNPFGVLDFLAWDQAKFNHHYRLEDVEKSVALMREAGIGFVRFDFLWEDIEPTLGQFTFEKYDQLVAILQKNNIRTQALLVYNPSWSGKRWNEAPDLVAFSRYAQATVHHFKDRIRHWELWHEPDSPAFWQPQDNMQTYVRLLKLVYPLLKAADPTCLVHLGGMSRALPMSLKCVYEEGGKDFFDVINIHPFANPLSPNALDAVKHIYKFVLRVIKEYGDQNKPIWFTEIGCPGMRNPRDSSHWWLGANPSEEAQAAWVKALYGEVLSWENVQKVFWCFFRDVSDHFKCGSDYDGLIRNDFSKKPSFEAYRELTTRYFERSAR